MKTLFKNVSIRSLAYEEAPCIISNSWLEEKLKAPMEKLEIPKGKLEELTGIKERRFWEKSETPRRAAARVAQKMLDSLPFDKKEIDLLLNTSIWRHHLEPAEAAHIHRNLNLDSHCMNFDITNACMGFLNGICVVGSLIEQGAIKYGLVVSSEGIREVVENSIKMLNSTDLLSNVSLLSEKFLMNFANLTVGCGSAAMILCHKDLFPEGPSLNGAFGLSDSSCSELCLADPVSWTMETDSKVILEKSIELSIKTWAEAGKFLPQFHDEKVDLYVPHQIGLNHLKKLQKSLGLNSDKIYKTFPVWGNTSSVAVPGSLAKAHEEKRMKPGDHVVLLGGGSGINAMAMSLTWGSL